MPQKKFITTQDQTIGNLLLANGFYLVSNVSGVYTFINKIPEKFNFDSVDITKLHFTNILYI